MIPRINDKEHNFNLAKNNIIEYIFHSYHNIKIINDKLNDNKLEAKDWDTEEFCRFYNEWFLKNNEAINEKDCYLKIKVKLINKVKVDDNIIKEIKLVLISNSIKNKANISIIEQLLALKDNEGYNKCSSYQYDIIDLKTNENSKAALFKIITYLIAIYNYKTNN